MKNLQLSLKTKWFEMTKSGIKTEDYREINEYWIKRIFSFKKGIYYLPWNEFAEHIKVPNNRHRTLEDIMLIWDFSFKPFTQNTMTLGCPKLGDTERILKLEHKGIEIRTGNPEWGAEPGRLYFVIKHGKIIK